MSVGARPRRVLAVGAHPDDIEIGCGGTLISHVDAGDEVSMLVMTGGELGARLGENVLNDRRAEAEAAAAIMGVRVLFGPFFDGHIPLTSDAVNVIEEYIRELGVDTLYCHALDDSHQDHVFVGRAAAAAGRRLQRVVHYQGPSTGRFNPTHFVDISDQLDRKLATLKQHTSQLSGSSTLDLETVESTARYWGSRARLGLAEPFETSRFVWAVAD